MTSNERRAEISAALERAIDRARAVIAEDPAAAVIVATCDGRGAAVEIDMVNAAPPDAILIGDATLHGARNLLLADRGTSPADRRIVQIDAALAALDNPGHLIEEEAADHARH